LVGYLFRQIGIVKRALFIIAAVGLLIPVVQTGQYVELTWMINGVGLVLAVVMVALEWLARAARQKSHPMPVTSESKVT
jgi:hypothetical protein